MGLFKVKSFLESQGENITSTSSKYKERKKKAASEIHNSAHYMTVVEL